MTSGGPFQTGVVCSGSLLGRGLDEGISEVPLRVGFRGADSSREGGWAGWPLKVPFLTDLV